VGTQRTGRKASCEAIKLKNCRRTGEGKLLRRRGKSVTPVKSSSVLPRGKGGAICIGRENISGGYPRRPGREGGGNASKSPLPGMSPCERKRLPFKLWNQRMEGL